MNADCAFAIGKTHHVCQDYAAAGDGGAGADGVFVLLADGCSSSPDTDIGARLLVKAAQGQLPGPSAAPAVWDACHEAALRRAAACAERLGLRPDCLDATLLTVTAGAGAFTACCYGDGVVILGRQDGRLEVHAVSYAASYPDYPSYQLDDTRRRQWEAQPGNEKRVEHWIFGPDGAAEGDVRPSHRVCELWTGTAGEYRFAAVLSDGVQSFTETCETDTSRTPRPVPLTDILPPLLAFKGSRGRFVQRRVTAFLKECRARRRQHGDDFSLGVVWLETP